MRLRATPALILAATCLTATATAAAAAATTAAITAAATASDQAPAKATVTGESASATEAVAVLTAARIHTQDPRQPQATAMAWDGQGRIIAVGTTSVRVLESVAQKSGGEIVPGSGRTRIFIHPPQQFKIVNALLTNFHLPRSTLLMLVSAFAAPGELRGRELMLRAYAEAVRERYRFFSYGDAMFIQ